MKDAKFLFIASNEWAPWGGSEMLWSSAAEKLARAGNEVSVSVRDWGAPVKQVEYLRSVGCRIFQRRLPSIRQRIKRNIFRGRDYLFEHVHALGTGADLVVVSQGNNLDGLGWMQAAKANGNKYAVIVQAAGEQMWPTDDAAEKLAEYYESARAAFFVSRANLELSRRQFGSPLRNAKVVRNPFNVRYDAQPAWPGDPSKELVLACVARLDPAAKGQDLLIQVLNLPHWRSRNLCVTLVGSGPSERRLRLLVDNLKLPSVEFAGFVDDIEGLWSRHHAVVLPSRYEGLPLALVEAMLCGRPAIVTDVAGNAELVRDGVNGFLAKAPTVELLDEAMNRAWENRARLKEMGERAASDVRKFVSADPVEDFVRELEALADGAKG